MNDEKLEELNRRAYCGLGITFVLVAIAYYFLFIARHFAIQTTVGSIIIESILPITAIVSFFAMKYPKLRFLTCILMATGLAGINTLCTVKIGLIFITPCLLSLYQNKKQYMIITFLYTFILLCLSSYPRALGFDTFLMLNINKGHKVSEHVFASIFVLTVETIAVFSLLVPYYKYILDLKITKNQFLEEKANATDEVLQFCSKTMSYHNKYLAVHCTGVEAITTIILKDLIKRGMYSSYLTPENVKKFFSLYSSTILVRFILTQLFWINQENLQMKNIL